MRTSHGFVPCFVPPKNPIVYISTFRLQTRVENGLSFPGVFFSFSPFAGQIRFILKNTTNPFDRLSFRVAANELFAKFETLFRLPSTTVTIHVIAFFRFGRPDGSVQVRAPSAPARRVYQLWANFGRGGPIDQL